jgi:hypothetical protein
MASARGVGAGAGRRTEKEGLAAWLPPSAMSPLPIHGQREVRGEDREYPATGLRLGTGLCLCSPGCCHTTRQPGWLLAAAIYIPRPLWAVALTPKQLSLSLSLFLPPSQPLSHPLSLSTAPSPSVSPWAVAAEVTAGGVRGENCGRRVPRRTGGSGERCAGMLSTGFLELSTRGWWYVGWNAWLLPAILLPGRE